MEQLFTIHIVPFNLLLEEKLFRIILFINFMIS